MTRLEAAAGGDRNPIARVLPWVSKEPTARPYGARSEQSVGVGDLLMRHVPVLARGDLEVDGPGGGLVWHRPAALGPSAVGVPGVLVAREAHLVAVEACIADFVRAAAANGAAEMSGAEGLHDLAVVDAALRSIASGRMESVAHV